MKKQIVAFDAYGTMLPTKGEQVKRKNLDFVLNTLLENDFVLCTVSDALLRDLWEDMRAANLDKEYFNHFFKMASGSRQDPKNFEEVLSHYKISPSGLYVIGDQLKRDILPAESIGATAIHVPEFIVCSDNSYDMREVLNKIR